MSRLTDTITRYYLLSLAALPLLAQTSGCLGNTDNEVRQTLAATASTVVSAMVSAIISDAVNGLMDVSSSPFSQFL